jgi:hypothetical protein
MIIQRTGEQGVYTNEYGNAVYQIIPRG